MTEAGKARAKRHGTKSKYAGDEPRADEFTTHLPRTKRKTRRAPTLSKLSSRLKRKDTATRRAAIAAYEARLDALWQIVSLKKEG